MLPQWAGPLVCTWQGDNWCDVHEEVNCQSMEATLASQPLTSNLEINLLPTFFKHFASQEIKRSDAQFIKQVNNSSAITVLRETEFSEN